MLRVIRESKARWILGENVLGIVNWDGGLVFEEVQADLEAAGYEVQTYILPAVGIDAPHRRDRVWFVAFNPSNQYDGRYHGGTSKGDGDLSGYGTSEISQHQETGIFKHSSSDTDSISGGSEPQQFSSNRERPRNQFDWGDTKDQSEWRGLEEIFRSPGEDVAYATKPRSQGDTREGIGSVRKEEGESTRSKLSGTYTEDYWREFPTQPPVLSGDDGISDRLDFETVFKGAKRNKRSTAYIRWRTEAIKAFGNSMVPQIPYQLFKAIEAYEQQLNIK